MRFLFRALLLLCLIVVVAVAGIIYWNISRTATKPGEFSFTWLPAANDAAPGAAFDRYFARNSRRGAALAAEDSAAAAPVPAAARERANPFVLPRRDASGTQEKSASGTGGRVGGITGALRKSSNQ